MKRKAHYPVRHTQIKTFTSSCGAQQVSNDNVFLGPIPERILIALVKNTEFVGSASTNPFHFYHYDMTNHVLYVNGVQHPPEPLTMDYSSRLVVTRAYESLFSSTGELHDYQCSYDYLTNIHQQLLHISLYPNSTQRGGRRTNKPPS